MTSATPLCERLEGRSFMSVSPVVVNTPLPAPLPPAAVSPAVIQRATKWNYVGTFSVTSPKGVVTTGKISVGLVKGYGRGTYYVNVKVGGTIFDGNMYTNATTGITYVNWFTFDANWNQVPKGSLIGTIVNGVYSGTMTKAKAVGTFTMNAVP